MNKYYLMHVHTFAKKASVTVVNHELKLPCVYSENSRVLWKEKKGTSKLSGQFELRKISV